MKIFLVRKQKIIGLLILVLLLILIVYLVFFNNYKNNKNYQDINEPSASFAPSFLDNEEKIKLNIRPETKIQVLKRNAQGKVELYKVINNDRDIITDLNQITPTILPAKK